MLRNPIKSALAFSLFLTPVATPSAADNLGAALLGGSVGGALINEVNRNKKLSSWNARWRHGAQIPFGDHAVSGTHGLSGDRPADTL